MDSYIDRGLSDGWPVVPPASAAVKAMITASGQDGEDVLGEFAYRASPVRIRDVAANAVMAGCLPEYMPVVVAALEILIDPSFGTEGWGASTNSFVPWLVINGPVRRRIGLNCGAGVMGPGNRANATIGRAIRLSLINLAGESIMQRDCGTMGNPFKFTCCFGEDEEGLDWPPLHTEMGCNPGESTVLAIVTRHPRHLTHTFSHSPEHFLGALADDLGTLGEMGPPISRSTGQDRHGKRKGLILLGAGHRRDLREAGWTKQMVRTFLQHTAVQRSDMTPAYQRSDDFLIIGAGGLGPSSLSANAFKTAIRRIPDPPATRSFTNPGNATVGVDGLPTMPGSPIRLAAIAAAMTNQATAGPLTADEIARNALRAGCLPEHMPVVIAGLQAAYNLCDPTSSFSRGTDLFPIMIVNGPVRQRLRLNSGRGAFGPGTRANATIGRAIASCMGVPRPRDGLGTPYLYSSGVVAEDEESSPWPPLHTEFGFAPEESTVTMLLCAQARQTTIMVSTQPETILKTLADDMSAPQNYDTLAGCFEGPTKFLVALCEDFRKYLANGWTRLRVQDYLAGVVGRTAGEVRRRGYPVDPRRADSDFAPLSLPKGFLVAAIGGGGGHSLTARVLRHTTVRID